MNSNTYDGLAVFKPIGGGGYGPLPGTVPKTLVAGANISIVTDNILQTQTISTAAPVGVSKYVDLTDVDATPLIPHALSYYDPVSAKFKQTAAVTFDSSSNFGVETLGAIALVANGGPASLQSTNEEVVVAGQLDATISAATGDCKIQSLLQEIQHFSTGNTTFELVGVSSVVAITNESPASYAAKVSSGDGNVLPNKQFVTDAVANAIVSASDVVSKQIQFEATTMGVTGTGVDKGKISFAPNVLSPTLVTSFVASNFAADFADPGYIPYNIFSGFIGGELVTFRWVGSGEITEASYVVNGPGVFHPLPFTSYEASLTHISGGGDTGLSPLDAVVYFSYTPAQPAPTPPDLSSKATIGGDASVLATYNLGTTAAASSTLTSIKHLDVPVLEATSILTKVSGELNVIVEADTGDVIVRSVLAAVDIQAPVAATVETNDSALTLTNVDTRISRTVDRVVINDTTTELLSVAGNVVLSPDPVSGLSLISSDPNDYSSLVATQPSAVPNVAYVNGIIRSAAQYTSGGRNSVLSGDLQVSTNSNTVFHNAISYVAIENVTTLQFDCIAISGQCRFAIFSGSDTTAVLLAQTNAFTPVLGLNTVPFINSFDLTFRQNLVIGFAVPNNTLKANGVQSFNSITRGWNGTGGSLVLAGFGVVGVSNPQAKASTNQTSVLINVF